MSDDRPNIILIMTDQHKASATRAYGNKIVQTPTFDGLAAEGVTFESCYSTSAVCTPARGSIMTGTHVPLHGATANSRKIMPQLLQLPQYLQLAGYHTGVVGHHDGFAGLNRGWDYEIDWWDKRHRLCDIFWEADRLANEPKPLRVWVSGAHPRPADQGLAARFTDHAEEYIDMAANKKEPFFLHLCYVEPHPIYFPPAPYASMYDPDEVDFPPQPDPAHQPPWQIEAAAEMYVPHATERDKRLALARYYGLITYADEQFGRIMYELFRLGLTDRTWIFFASDHGDYAGEHGLFSKTETPYDCLLNVPLIVRPPDGFLQYDDRGSRKEGLVQTFDLFPTILELVGIDRPEPMQAFSLMNAIQGGPTPERDAVFAAVVGNARPRASFPQGMPKRGVHKEVVRMVRTEREKYIRDPENGDEYYNFRNDPHEIVCRNPEEAPGDLVRRLDEWEQECKDLRERVTIPPKSGSVGR